MREGEVARLVLLCGGRGRGDEHEPRGDERDHGLHMELQRARAAEVAGSGDARLARRAAAVLRANDADGYTVPARSTYPHQWNWDSALASLGWAELDPGRAYTELERLAGARDPQGMVPHIAFAPPAEGRRYEPGPDRWGARLGADGRRISGITQPPLAATCLRLLFERHPDEPRARALLAPLHAWQRFLLRERDPHGLGEPVLIHPWESGRDNAVEWDLPLARVPAEPRRLPPRRDTDHVHAAERPSDEHYRRFLALVRAGTAAGWPQERLAREGAFRVLDPGFSAILARAALDLAWLAERLGEARIAAESGEAGERVAEALRARADADGLIRRRRPDRGRAAAGHRRRVGARAAGAGAGRGRRRGGAPARVRGRALLPVRRALARSRPPGALRAQLLARPRLGERHLARRPRARGPRRGGRPRPSCAGGCWRPSSAAACASTSRPARGAASAAATSAGPPRSACARRPRLFAGWPRETTDDRRRALVPRALSRRCRSATRCSRR